MKSRIAALTAIVLTACAAATTFENTHKGENIGQIDFKGRKVAAVVIGAGVTQQRQIDAETVLAKELSARGMDGVAGHSIVPVATTTPMTRERAIAMLQEAGVAGMVVLKLVDTEKKTVKTQWADTQFQQTLVNYTYFGPIGYEGNTYDRSITTITIETSLYSLGPLKLLWAGQSESVDPAKVDSFIPQFARDVAAELRREGLVK